jgi:nucleoside 2-deoxyribosyltransferase
MTTPLVYVAGPYSAPTSDGVLDNIRTAVNAGNALMDAGLDVLVPHLSDVLHAAKPRDYERWMTLDFNLLSRCDAVYRLDGVSPGADREVDYARRLGIPVFRDLQGLKEWASGWGNAGAGREDGP